MSLYTCTKHGVTGPMACCPSAARWDGRAIRRAMPLHRQLALIALYTAVALGGVLLGLVLMHYVWFGVVP